MAFILLLVVIIWLLAFIRAGMRIWTGTFAILLILRMILAGRYSAIEWILCLLFLIAASIINVPSLRSALLMKPVFRLFRRMLPSISPTEREALEAGTVWWDGELMSGSPNWEKLLGMPKSQLSAEEQAFLDGPVDELCRMLDDWQIASSLRDLPQEVWQFIKKRGFFGIIIPKEYGGLGFSTLAHSHVIMKLASRSVAAAVTVMVPNSLGPAELLLRYGTKEQKEHHLPLLANGEEIPCFALTGPEAGSDAASIPDTGIVCRDLFGGEEIIGIRLNWEKRYITLGPVATILGLAFRLRDPDLLLGRDKEPGITLALIPTDMPGIVIGNRHNPLGVPFQNGPNRGKDVFIPLEWIIGGPAGAGQGWRMLMECLAAGRSISLPALSSGGGKFAARVVGAYARIRRQFRQPIGRFEGIQAVLARIAGNAYLMDAARVTTCNAVDIGERPAVISAIVKYHFTEKMRTIVNDAMDVLGGSGICLGPRNLMARLYQAAPIGITVEGANILTRSMIIFGQGLVRCHPYLLKEMEAVTDPDAGRGFARFDSLLREHAAFTLRNAAHALFFGITGGRLIKAPKGPERRYYQAATRFSAALALTADAVLLLIGGALKKRERISARFADIMGYLYLISALLRQFRERQSPIDELPLLQWGCEDCLHKIHDGFVELFDNLPSRPVAWLLRLLIFPCGTRFAGPHDRVDSRVAEILMEPSLLRDRLTAGIFLPKDQSDPLGRLEDALEKVQAAEAPEQKIHDAEKEGRIKRQNETAALEEGIRAGIIAGHEADSIRRAMAARRDVIEVDDFPHL
jgi:acyl-CoA dehydrogenase